MLRLTSEGDGGASSSHVPRCGRDRSSVDILSYFISVCLSISLAYFVLFLLSRKFPPDNVSCVKVLIFSSRYTAETQMMRRFKDYGMCYRLNGCFNHCDAEKTTV